jgi:hypothetical protein
MTTLLLELEVTSNWELLLLEEYISCTRDTLVILQY